MIGLKEALRSSRVADKSRWVEWCLKSLREGEEWSDTQSIERFDTPSYSTICTIVDPKCLPKRKHLNTPEGLAILIHSITHIEYSAIDLALDALYRFKNMPRDYLIDWLVVAQDEIRHFYMLEELLGELGYVYGDFEVHCGLFDAANHTREDILERMAIIPRYYEASGLDVNPQIIKKLDNQRHNPYVAKLINALNIIYQEEIDHVYKGDRWFKYISHERGVNPEKSYHEILEKYALMNKHRPHINVEARKKAGFSCREILSLGASECR